MLRAIGNFVGGVIGGLLGRRRRHSDNSEEIRQIQARHAEVMKNLMAELEKNEKSHKENMRRLEEHIRNTNEENKKLISELKEESKKKEEEYQNKQKEKKLKKEMKQKQANKQLIEEIKDSKDFILKECEKDFDDMKDIYCMNEIENIKISDDIEELFLELFESENIGQLFLKNMLESIKNFKYNKQISSYNIQIIGRTGVGKSTLINTLLRTEVSTTSFGKIGTHETQEFSCMKYPFIKFIDTRGTELSSSNNIITVQENTLNYIEKRLAEKDPNKTIHCLLYCITSNRFEDIEADVVLKLRKKYKNGNLPIIIVYTQNYFEEDYEKMKNFINAKLKTNNETEIGEKVEDINLVGVVAKKKGNIKPLGLDKLLNYLKLKAKSSFLIATVNMIKKYCVDLIEVSLNQTLNNILSDINDFLPLDNDSLDDSILSDTIKNVFLEFLTQDAQTLSEKGENILKKISKKLFLEINEIQQKNLKEFAKDYSERIGLEIDKAQYNVINQNLGVKLNIKEYSFFQKEGQTDLEILLKEKSIKYANINFAKKICEKSAVKFKSLFKESIEEIIEKEKEINDLISKLNNNISEVITSKIDGLIEEIKIYQEK